MPPGPAEDLQSHAGRPKRGRLQKFAFCQIIRASAGTNPPHASGSAPIPPAQVTAYKTRENRGRKPGASIEFPISAAKIGNTTDAPGFLRFFSVFCGFFGLNAAWTRRGPRKSSRTPAARSVPHSRLLPNNPASAGTNPPACKRKRTYTPTQVKAYKTRENRGRPSSFLFQPLRNQLDLEQLRPPLAGHKQPIALRVVRDSVQHVDPDPLRQRQYPAQINPRHHLARH